MTKLVMLSLALLVSTSAVYKAESEHDAATARVIPALTEIEDVSQVRLSDGLRLLAFTSWPKGKDPQSLFIAYHLAKSRPQVVFRKKFDGAYSARLSIGYDTQRELTPVLVLFINYGAAYQKAVVFRLKDGAPSFVQELEGGSFDWIPDSHPFLELYCSGSSAVDDDEIFRWTGALFERRAVRKKPNQ